MLPAKAFLKILNLTEGVWPGPRQEVPPLELCSMPASCGMVHGPVMPLCPSLPLDGKLLRGVTCSWHVVGNICLLNEQMNE